MNAAIIALLAAQQAARQRICDAFERAGATSPATAQPLGRLGEIDESALRACIAEGSVREGAPGTFYLYPWAATPPTSGHARPVRTILVVLAVLLAIVILLPVFLVWMQGG